MLFNIHSISVSDLVGITQNRRKSKHESWHVYGRFCGAGNRSESDTLGFP